MRRANKDASVLGVLRIINEPTTPAIAYGLDKKGGEQQIIVYDFGAGTFDVSPLSIDDVVFEVLATAGDTHLGGEDFDNRVTDYFVKETKKKTGTDVSPNLCAMGKLMRVVERALSSQQSTRDLVVRGGNDFSETVTRARFKAFVYGIKTNWAMRRDSVARSTTTTKRDDLGVEDMEQKLAEVQAAINPIMTKLYAGVGDDYAALGGGDQDPFFNRDES